MIRAVMLKADSDYRANLEAAAKMLVESLSDLTDAEVQQFFQRKSGLLLKASPIVLDSAEDARAMVESLTSTAA